MRDSDWSRQNVLRSDWLGLIGAPYTTEVDTSGPFFFFLSLPFRFLFFFLEYKGTVETKTKKRCREDIYI